MSGTLPPRAMLLRALPAEEGGGWELLAPDTGFFVHPPRRGACLRAGDPAGELEILERRQPLILPPEAAGTVVEDPPAERRLPVAWGTPLFRIRPFAANEDAARADAPGAVGSDCEADSGRVLRAPQPGRFWLRPEPGADPYVAPGEALPPGRTVGLLEVMKTFNPVKFPPELANPSPPRLLRFLVEDGAEVEEGHPLLEFGP